MTGLNLKSMDTNTEWFPIALFCYKRLDHLRKTIEALEKNEGASKSALYVFSDASKNEHDEAQVREVKDYIEGINGFKEVIIVKRNENYGLARNIVQAVTELVNKYGAVIVLEDDIVTSPYFLMYMNKGLKRYWNEPRVMAVNAWQYPINTFGLDDFYFEPWFECWGWGTWKDAWDKYSNDANEIVNSATDGFIKYVNYNGTEKDPWKQVLRNASGEMKTWAIFFYIAICRNNGLVLAPKVCYAHNIGFDGSGEDCIDDDIYGESVRKYADGRKCKFPDLIEQNKKATKRIMLYHNLRRNKITGRLFNLVLKYRIGGLNLVFKKAVKKLERKR